MLRCLSSVAVTALSSVLFLGASSEPAAASSITLVAVNLGCVPNGTGADACPESDGDQDATFTVDGLGGFLQVTDETDGYADANFDYSGAADAQYGILHATATGTFSGLTANAATSIRTVEAVAVVTDLLTITATGQSGSGMLDVSFILDGLLQRSAGAGAFAFAAVSAGQSDELFNQSNTTVPFDSILSTPSGPLTATVPFVWGQPFYLSLVLGVGAGTPASCAFCASGDTNATPATVASGSATADFFNTLILSGLVARDGDALATPVLNAQYASGSGAVYSINGIVAQPVPEPASLLLLGSGLVLAVRRRRS